MRACAARLLGGTLDAGYRDEAGNVADDAAPPGWFDRGLLAHVVERDLARPGVLGPFLAAGEPDLSHLPFDPLPLMLDVMERRADERDEECAATIVRCLAATALLSDWESGFLETLAKQLLNGRRPSPRQAEILDEIATKAGLAP